jgi:hypothetical protein
LAKGWRINGCGGTTKHEEIRRVFYALISKLWGSVDRLEDQDAKRRRTEQLDWGISIFNSAVGQRELEEAFLSSIAVFYRWPSLDAYWKTFQEALRLPRDE